MDGFGDEYQVAVPHREDARGDLDLISAPRMPRAMQQTLRSTIDCMGIGLHGGQHVRIALHPAAAGSGIGFTRTDIAGNGIGQRDGVPLPARYDRVVETRLCTVIGDAASGVSIGTIEHLMAALSGSGIDNALVTLDGPEVPILDGSAEPFMFLIECAGVAESDVPRTFIDVLQPVRVATGEAWAELRPFGRSGQPGLDLSLRIDFAAAAIGRQMFALRLTPDSFRRDLAAARTFTQAGDITQLRQAGLALGGNLDNAIVVDGDSVLNPGGLRMPDEFVRHKLLDAVGDLALAGGMVRGRFIAHRSGHALNNTLLHALFAAPGAWRAVGGETLREAA